MWYAIPVALLCMASAIQGLDLYTAKEQACFNIPKPETPVLDMKWVLETHPLYYPLMSTVDLYRVAVNLLQKDPKDVKASAVYYDSCLKWEIFSNGTIFSEGFDGLRREYETKTLSDNPDAYTFVPVGGDEDFYAGTAYTTLTDNKSFFFTVACLKTGEMTWGVGSTTPTLTEETKKKILDHAVTLGFSTEDVTELKYKTCEN
ncbi:unnamed protein product [Orchesella dallaii]|uniref:Uncharacterized protein n=1 Tax=Orchesella dallaii TaxID=48710 RepID=A0ABP1QTU6_9HEXA